MNIMLIGKMASGKDQVAAMLPRYNRVALADSLRELVAILRNDGVGASFSRSAELLGEDNVPNDLLYILRLYSQMPRTTKERPLLQGIGTYFRECNNDVWINTAKSKLVRGSNVITDVRRISEFKAFKALGFKAIYIEAPEELRIQRLRSRDGGYDENTAKHKAEAEIESLKELCDSVIINDGTLNDLETSVDREIAWLNFTETN